jgi:hypothetical protein
MTATTEKTSGKLVPSGEIGFIMRTTVNWRNAGKGIFKDEAGDLESESYWKRVTM